MTLRVVTRRRNRLSIVLDADKRIDGLGEFNSEEPYSAVEVDEVSCAAAPQQIAHRFNERWQQEKVILEKRVRRHIPIRRRDAQNDFESALWRRIRPDAPDLLVDGGFRDPAFFDVFHQSTVPADKTNIEPLLRLVPLAPDHDAIAVAVVLGTGNQRRHPRAIEAPDAPDEVDDLFMFDVQLFRVVDVLILTTAARTEINAWRRNATGRGRNDADQVRPRKTFFHFADFHFDLLADDHERHKNHELVNPRDAFASERHVADLQRQFPTRSQIHVITLEFLRSAKKFFPGLNAVRGRGTEPRRSALQPAFLWEKLPRPPATGRNH